MSLNLNATSPTRTLCEVLREIIDITHDRPDIQELVKEAMLMGKKMSEKLVEYKSFAEVNKDLSPAANHNYERNLERRKQ